MKKALSIIGLCLVGITGQAQFQHVFLRAGYLIGNTQLDNYKFSATDQPDGSIVFGDFESANIVNRHVPIDIEAYGENFMFQMGFSLKPKKWYKEHEDSPGLTGTDGQGFWTRLGFGGYFGGGPIGLMISAQYRWNPTEIINDNTLNDGLLYDRSRVTDYSSASGVGKKYFYHDFNGGNQKGFGAHLMIAPENRALLKLGANYEWLIRRTRKGGGSITPWNIKGTALTAEAALYFMFDPDENIGISFNASYSIRNTQYEQVENMDAPEPIYDPGMTMKGFNFSINLLLPGEWFAGQSVTTYTITVLD